MKHPLVFLGLAASLLFPLAVQADPESARTGDDVARAKTSKTTVASAHAPAAHRVVYITSRGSTGSHLPIVVGRYQGHYDSMAPNAVYGRPDLDRTGQLDVAGELYQRDPSISSARGGR